jgi:uncharacterized protein
VSGSFGSRLLILGIAIAVAAPAGAADQVACRELERKYDMTRAGITAIQLNAMLFTAADKGCDPLARRLLDDGGSPLARDRDGAMALAHAARAGQTALVQMFLELGAPIDARNIAGSTALYAAAESDRAAVVRLLLDKGADPNLPGRSGVTPLGAAAFRGNVGVVDTLLAHGADAKIADRTGKAPIVYAAAFGFTAIVSRLIAAGVDPNARYGNDLTALMWAAGHDDGAGLRDIEAVIELLVERGAQLDLADNRGRTALMIAAENGHATVVELLLRHGADRSLRDRDGKTALELATNDSVRERLAER